MSTSRIKNTENRSWVALALSAIYREIYVYIVISSDNNTIKTIITGNLKQY
jgi:hypothetical protein